MQNYTYEIDPRPAELGGGWRLRLLIDGQEEGGGAFPADAHADPAAGMAWWNGLDEGARRDWMKQAGDTGRAVDAYAVYLAREAHDDATAEAEAWLVSVEQRPPEYRPRPADDGGSYRLMPDDRLLSPGASSDQGKPEFDTGPRAMRSDGEPLTGVPEVDLDDPTAPEDLGNAR
ncbi:hypothetical protein [Xanthomonas fragariae]|uniref:hypothetical protein n=1 Tax=Xanthomonas fragariae TaxID=48664 RepID=UPI001ABDE1FE|nr:hypothetical protein [Xanthomonas fragariae]UKR54312.1 hypothetical protein K4A87_19580 [Xanthomonas fragariae]